MQCSLTTSSTVSCSSTSSSQGGFVSLTVSFVPNSYSRREGFDLKELLKTKRSLLKRSEFVSSNAPFRKKSRTMCLMRRPGSSNTMISIPCSSQAMKSSRKLIETLSRNNRQPPLPDLLRISLNNYRIDKQPWKEMIDCLENYTILSTIGEGAYAMVKLARRRQDNKLYALKKVRMRSHADLLHRFDHPR